MDPVDKTALVTGGASGIGLATAKELLQQGAKGVSICDVKVTKGETEVKQLQQEFGKNKAIFIKTDVTKEDEVEAAFKQTIKELGGLDIVINNAGIFNDKQWERCISINVNGIIRTALLALKYMGRDKDDKGGVIVNMASIAGLGAGTTVTPVYNASKHAVIGMSRSLGCDYILGTTGVRVVCICPGFTTTTEIYDGETTVITARDDWMPELMRLIGNHSSSQGVEHVSKAILQMIREANNGAIWVIENKETPYEIKIPYHSKLRV